MFTESPTPTSTPGTTLHDEEPVWSPLDRQGRLAVRAGRGAYAASVLHAPVLVLVSLAARPLPLPLEAKFVLVAAAGVVAAFGVGWAVTRSALVARFV